MSGGRKGWEPDEVVRLRQLVAQHKSAAEIAADLGRSELSIYSKAQALGLNFLRKIKPETHEWGGTHMISDNVTTTTEKKSEGAQLETKKVKKTRIPYTNKYVEVPSASERHLKLLSSIQDTLARAVQLTMDAQGSPEAWILFGQVQAGLGYLHDMIEQDEPEVP